MPRRFLLLFSCVSIGLASPVSDAPTAQAWRALRERRPTESYPLFEHALRKDDVEPETALGRAVALLNRQPRTRENIAQADAYLADLARAPGDVGAHARLLRARIAEVHFFEPDLVLAARRYEELLAEHPGHPIAQSAVPKLVRLRIYQLGDDPLAALADAEAWADKLTDPSARRDYHVIMARSYLFSKTAPRRALDHLLAARQAGQLIPQQAASTLVAIAELARELGEHSLAREAYAEFLHEYPRDQRRHMVRQRLTELPETDHREPVAP